MSLVLSRKVNEKLIIKSRKTDEEIVIAVARIQSGSVRLAIDADIEWVIVRDELIDADGKPKPHVTKGSD
jgi:carbon storage regulator CsrA